MYGFQQICLSGAISAKKKIDSFMRFQLKMFIVSKMIQLNSIDYHSIPFKRKQRGKQVALLQIISTLSLLENPYRKNQIDKIIPG